MLRVLWQFEFISAICAIIERSGCGSFANFCRSSSLRWSKFRSYVCIYSILSFCHFTGETSSTGWDAAIVATAATNSTAAAAITGNFNGVAAAIAATTAAGVAATTATAVGATTTTAVTATTAAAVAATTATTVAATTGTTVAATTAAAAAPGPAAAAEPAAAGKSTAATEPAAAAIPAAAAWTGEIAIKYYDDYLVKSEKQDEMTSLIFF